MSEAPSASALDGPSKRTTSPSVTGTTVLAKKYKDGIMMMTDTLGSYGTLSRFTELDRMRKGNDFTLIGGSGEWSDFQYIMKLISELSVIDFEEDDGHVLQPREVYSYLSRVLYNRRSKVDPLWNHLVIGGVDQNGKSFLGSVDLYGSCFEDDIVATGFGTHLALPLMRKHWRADLDEKEARNLIESSMRVCLYRDCRTINKFQIGTVTVNGTTPDKNGQRVGPNVTQPYALSTEWKFKAFLANDC